MKIKTKLSIYFLMMVIVPLLLLTLILLRSGQVRIYDAYINELEAIAEMQAKVVQLHIQSLSERMTDFSSDGKIKDCLEVINENAENTCTAQQLNEHLVQNKLPVFNELKQVDIIDLSGKVVASSESSSLGTFVNQQSFEHFSESDYFLEIQKDNDVANIVITKSIQKNIDKKELLGYIRGVIAINQLNAIVESKTGFRNDAEVFMIIQNKYDKETFLFPHYFRDRGDFEDNEVLENFEAMRMALVSEEGVLQGMLDYQGIPVIAVFRHMNESGLNIRLVTKVDVNQVNSNLNQQIKTAIVVLLFSIFLTIIIVKAIANDFARPLEELSDKATSISNGNLNVSLSNDNIHNEDEISKLSHAFTVMVKKLQSYYGELERKASELEVTKKEIEAKLNETERLNALMVNRELKMVELKKRIAELEEDKS